MLPYTALDLIHVLQRSLSTATSGQSSQARSISSRLQRFCKRAASMLIALK